MTACTSCGEDLIPDEGVCEACDTDWPTTNRLRGQLIDKDIDGTLTAEETTRLDALQAFADYYIKATTPRTTLDFYPPEHLTRRPD